MMSTRSRGWDFEAIEIRTYPTDQVMPLGLIVEYAREQQLPAYVVSSAPARIS